MKRIFSGYVWDVPAKEKVVYLTFDDGPTAEITEWVLSQLREFNAKATFFCIGRNVNDLPGILASVVSDGHAIGNHSYNHLNGWKTPFKRYVDNVGLCDEALRENNVHSRLFRPPYGKFSRKQSLYIRKKGYKVIMWDILTADFDQTITPEKCLQNVVKNVTPGSIIIFHDSVKAFSNLKYALPETLRFLKKEGYRCDSLEKFIEAVPAQVL